jgi:hypothetical protein
MKLITFSIVLLIVFLSSCTKDKNQIIADDFKIYVQRFFEEANKRGLPIKLEDNDLQIKFSKLIGKNGTCFPQKKLIEIDSVLWKQRSEFDKEWLIYHELGHCTLGRDHLVRALPHGECESIMSNSEGFNCAINFSSESWRKYYFDELFSQKLIVPSWYNDTLLLITDTVLIKRDKKINFKEDSFLFDVNQIDTSKNFVIDFNFIKSAKVSRDICLQFDNKIVGLKTILDANIATIRNVEGYNFAGRSNIYLGNTIRIKVVKNKRYYHFWVNNTIIHTMDFDTVKNRTIKISCFSTENDFEYEVYNFI